MSRYRYRNVTDLRKHRQPVGFLDDPMLSPPWVDEEDVREATATSSRGSSSSFTPWPPETLEGAQADGGASACHARGTKSPAHLRAPSDRRAA